MSRSLAVLIRPGLLVLTVCLTLGAIARAADAEKEDVDGKKRAVLWKAMEESLPKEHEEIGVYAENPSLTAVLFRSHGLTMRFSLQDGKVEEVMHMKKLGTINRITFEEVQGRGNWVLWYNGQRELTIGD